MENSMLSSGPQTRQIYKLIAKEVIDHTHQVRELVLATQNEVEFSFQAGQFVTLHVPQEPKPALRAYSIASSDQNKKGFRLLFKHIENGVASTYVWTLKVGDILTFTGPFGRVLFKEPAPKQLVFLNTGTGISQHLSFILSKMHLYPNHSFKLYFGVRSEKDIYYTDALEDLKRKLPNFEYHMVLSQPSDSWKGKTGYVQQFIEETDYRSIDSHFYLCGNGKMIKDTKHILIEGAKVDKTKIFAEAFD
jgi:ferredoxin-NADP reductase